MKKIFEKLAVDYDQYAALMQAMAEGIVERLSLTQLQPRIILDLACGTGYALPLLKQAYPKADIYGVDCSMAMLRQAQNKQASLVANDVEQLAFADNSVDLIVANAFLPWCQDPVTFFKECHRVLREHGLLFFSSFGPDTFSELGVKDIFPDMHNVGDALMAEKFVDPVMEVHPFELSYPSDAALAKEFECLALDCFVRPKAGVQSIYIEGVYGHAWKPVDSGTVSADEDGVVRVPISKIQRRQ